MSLTSATVSPLIPIHLAGLISHTKDSKWTGWARLGDREWRGGVGLGKKGNLVEWASESE